MTNFVVLLFNKVDQFSNFYPGYHFFKINVCLSEAWRKSKNKGYISSWLDCKFECRLINVVMSAGCVGHKRKSRRIRLASLSVLCVELVYGISLVLMVTITALIENCCE